MPSQGIGTEGRSSLEVGLLEKQCTSRQVATRRLDDFNLVGIGFVKIDVEGHEFAVLEGATELLDSQRPTVLIEVEPRSDQPRSLDNVVEFFSERGYRGEYLHRGAWHPVDVSTAGRWAHSGRVARQGYATNLLFYARRYVHNFLFTPR